jgi:hypothetical protein
MDELPMHPPFKSMAIPDGQRRILCHLFKRLSAHRYCDENILPEHGGADLSFVIEGEHFARDTAVNIAKVVEMIPGTSALVLTASMLVTQDNHTIQELENSLTVAANSSKVGLQVVIIDAGEPPKADDHSFSEDGCFRFFQSVSRLSLLRQNNQRAPHEPYRAIIYINDPTRRKFCDDSARVSSLSSNEISTHTSSYSGVLSANEIFRSLANNDETGEFAGLHDQAINSKCSERCIWCASVQYCDCGHKCMMPLPEWLRQRFGEQLTMAPHRPAAPAPTPLPALPFDLAGRRHAEWKANGTLGDSAHEGVRGLLKMLGDSTHDSAHEGSSTNDGTAASDDGAAATVPVEVSLEVRGLLKMLSSRDRTRDIAVTPFELDAASLLVQYTNDMQHASAQMMQIAAEFTADAHRPNIAVIDIGSGTRSALRTGHALHQAYQAARSGLSCGEYDKVVLVLGDLTRCFRVHRRDASEPREHSSFSRSKHYRSRRAASQVQFSSFPPRWELENQVHRHHWKKTVQEQGCGHDVCGGGDDGHVCASLYSILAGVQAASTATGGRGRLLVLASLADTTDKESAVGQQIAGQFTMRSRSE